MKRGALSGALATTALTWAIYLVDRSAWPGIVLPMAFTGLAVVNLVVTHWRPGLKVGAVRLVQRRLVNPAVVGLLRLGINPLGVTLLETQGRTTGRPRRVPVGAARLGAEVWLVAEHGERAGYVRNIAACPRVRLHLRQGWRRSWVQGTATVMPQDDPLARQRRLAGWNPLRWLNASMVRFLGDELLSVRVQLESPTDQREGATPTPNRVPATDGAVAA